MSLVIPLLDDSYRIVFGAVWGLRCTYIKVRKRGFSSFRVSAIVIVVELLSIVECR